MRPFRLETPERDPPYKRITKVIYTKNFYSEGVKVRDWQEILEHHPIDVDPYCQGKINYFLSHYNRLGTQDVPYRTTTQDMLEQIFIKDKLVPTKLMKNFYSYNDNADCLTTYKEDHCGTVTAPTYLTTMQHSYQMPKPYVMTRLAFPKIPFMKYRKYHHDPPNLSPHKFYDEAFPMETCQLQKHKSLRWTSYNPNTGNYTHQEIPTK